MDPIVRPNNAGEVRIHPWSGETIALRDANDRPPAPPPTKPADQPRTSGWDTWMRDEWHRPHNAPYIDPVWSYDRDQYPANWLKADAIAAAQMFSAAYDAALHLGERVRRLDVSWHRETEFNVQMYGRGPRGDLAPDEVHLVLDGILANRPVAAQLSELEVSGLHARVDLIWLRHSRSPSRLRVAVRDLRVRNPLFTEDECVRLVEAINEHCLVDFRDVLICVDPRGAVIYGRTKESQGISPRWDSFGPGGDPPMPGWPSRATDNRSEISGSSGDGSDEDDLPYSQSRYQRAVQLFRHAGRDYEKVLEEVSRLKKDAESMRRQAVTLATEAERSKNLYSILLDGLSVQERVETSPPEF